MKSYEHELEAKLWQVLLLFAAFYSLDSISTAIVSVMIGVKWSALDGTEKFIRAALIVKAWSSCMLALITMVVKKAKASALPLPDGAEIQQTTLSQTDTKITTDSKNV